MTGRPEQGYGIIGDVRVTFDAPHREGRDAPAELAAALVFPLDRADLDAAAWRILAADVWPDLPDWGDVDAGYVLAVLLWEGLGALSDVRELLARPARTPGEAALRARVRGHVTALFGPQSATPHGAPALAYTAATDREDGPADGEAGARVLPLRGRDTPPLSGS